MDHSEFLGKVPVVIAFLREQHKNMTSEQQMLVTKLTILIAINSMEPNEDMAIALRAMADYVDFMVGLEKK
jgi:hypothetical protein